MVRCDVLRYAALRCTVLLCCFVQVVVGALTNVDEEPWVVFIFIGAFERRREVVVDGSDC